MLVETVSSDRYTYELIESKITLTEGEGREDRLEDHGPLRSCKRLRDRCGEARCKSGRAKFCMKFALVDRIVEVDDARVVAIKSATLSEDYMHDHFPGFPVMPGVLMLECMYQASAWLVRQKNDFAHSLVLMKEAKNVKYSGLVKPGEQLTVETNLLSHEGQESKFKAVCRIDGKNVASARLVLVSSNLADTDPRQTPTDQAICKQLRADFETLAAPAVTV